MGRSFPAKSNLRKGLFALAGGVASVVITNLNRITAGFVLAQVLTDIVAFALFMLAFFYANKESTDRQKWGGGLQLREDLLNLLDLLGGTPSGLEPGVEFDLVGI